MAESREKCRELLDHVHGLLDQGWFYQGSAPGRSQSECRVTECSDLLGLVAELCGDCQRMAEALDGLLAEAKALNIGPTELRKFVGVDLVALATMHRKLAQDLAQAGNRALDTIGANSDGTTERRQQFREQATEPQRVCDSSHG